MNGKTHKSIAFLSTIGLAVTAFPSLNIGGIVLYPAIGILATDAGAKIADIDSEHSSYGKKYPKIASIIKHRWITHTGIVLLLMIAIFKLCGYLKSLQYGAFIETALVIFFVTGGFNISIKSIKAKVLSNLVALMSQLLILVYLAVYNPAMINTILCSLVFGFFYSYASHLLADLHNRKGIPLWYPICKKRIFLMAITTGTWEEYMFLGIYSIIIFGQIICVRFGIGIL